LSTVGAAMFRSFVISLVPVFSMLPWSFVFGLRLTACSVLVVPLYVICREKSAAQASRRI